MRIELIKRLGYAETIKILDELHNSVVKNRTNETIILTTHANTITMGRRTDISEILTERWPRLFKDTGLFPHQGAGARPSIILDRR